MELTEYGTSNYDIGILELNGTIELNGNVSLGGGCRICTVNENSILKFGKDVVITGNCHIVATDNISIGDNVLISWNVQMLDSDHHKIYNETNTIINKNKPINIQKKVWICSNVSLLKGANIPKNSIVESGSIVNKSFKDENILIINNEIKKKNILWKS